jgi:hypothetical protein
MNLSPFPLLEFNAIDGTTALWLGLWIISTIIIEDAKSKAEAAACQ